MLITATVKRLFDKQGSHPQRTHAPSVQKTIARKVRKIAVAILAAAAIGLGLWYPLEVDERSQVQHVTTLATRSLQADIMADWESEILAVIRVAKLVSVEDEVSDAAWQSSAKLFLADHPSYVAIYWADPAYHVRWAAPHEADSGSNFEPASNTPLRTALEAALDLGHRQLPATSGASTTSDIDKNQAEATLSATFRLANGERASRIVVPVHKHDRLIGFLVAIVELRRALDTILADHSGIGYAVAVLEGDQERYRMHGLNNDEQNFAQETEVHLRGVTWRIRVWPEPELLGEIRSKLPEVTFVTGALLGFLLVLTIHFAQTARQNSKDLQRANDGMEMRVQERTAEVHQLSGRLLRLQDEERRRIARELHDSTVQDLAGVGFYLEKASSLVVSGGNKKSGLERQSDLLDALGESISLLEKAAAEVRTISYLLHPPMLDDLGLEYAIGWVARGFSQRSGIQVDLDLQPDVKRLSPELELTLFRIVQEALTNVHRHSGSPLAKITISRDERHVTLEVADFGRGISGGAMGVTRDQAVNLGVGICGMRERVRQLGGQLEILSSILGTTIRAVLPLADSKPNGGDVPQQEGKIPRLVGTDAEETHTRAPE